MEAEHIFICAEAKAPAGELLKQIGLCEGFSNTYPGQGTAFDIKVVIGGVKWVPE